MNQYTFPVSELLTLGKPTSPFGAWDDYSRFGFGPEHCQELVRMITDMGLNTAKSTSSAVWAPLHAWRALANLQPLEALDAILAIHKAVLDETDSDQPTSDLIELSKRIGAAAIPSLDRYLADASMGESRIEIAEAIGRIAQSHPEAAPRCEEVLVRQLGHFQENEEILNGFLISALLDCEAVEAASLMERAFASGKVDETIAGDWPTVKYELGLTDERPTWRNPLFHDLLPVHGASTTKSHGDLRAKRKTQRQAKKKNRKNKR